MRRLLIRPGAIGDFIVSLPALEYLRADYTEVWTSEANLPLAQFATRADSIVATGLDALGVPDRPPPARLLDRLACFDSIVSWYGTGRPEFQEAVTAFSFSFHRALPPEGEGMHAVDYYLSQAGAPLGAHPRLHFPARRHDFAVIHPFSGSRRKNWPLDLFRELAEGLSSELEVRWTAGPEEELPEAVRFTRLDDLGQWMAGARIFIGNDSGIGHLAAAAGTPVVALFGPTDPRVWTPRGECVRVVRSPDGSIESIPVKAVLEAVRVFLKS
ncbi:MAG: glycosyltransferase family 9 protein [Acidobacteria bacterium]|nr:glycosyltransferase family 9 protein [Acidobacteriota bacterium]